MKKSLVVLYKWSE